MGVVLSKQKTAYEMRTSAWSSDLCPSELDDTLGRLTAEQGPVRSRSADMLDRVLLKGTEESPPRLSTLLEQIGGRAPLLVEIKGPGRHFIPPCFPVRRAPGGYIGKVGVLSFNPLVFAWFAAQAPPLLRGVGGGEGEKSGAKGR